MDVPVLRQVSSQDVDCAASNCTALYGTRMAFTAVRFLARQRQCRTERRMRSLDHKLVSVTKELSSFDSKTFIRLQSSTELRD